MSVNDPLTPVRVVVIFSPAAPFKVKAPVLAISGVAVLLAPITAVERARVGALGAMVSILKDPEFDEVLPAKSEAVVVKVTLPSPRDLISVPVRARSMLEP